MTDHEHEPRTAVARHASLVGEHEGDDASPDDRQDGEGEESERESDDSGDGGGNAADGDEQARKGDLDAGT